MVKPVFSFGKSGLQDWLLQRISAVVLVIYAIFLFSQMMANTKHSFIAWHELFLGGWLRCASLLALISLVIHAWIGMWTITTDYLKPVILRLPSQIIIILALLGYLYWGIKIIWGL